MYYYYFSYNILYTRKYNYFYVEVSSLHNYVPHVGYSLGDRPLAGYDRHNSGGECLKGFRMALRVVRSGENSSVYLITISANIAAQYQN